ncbi:MAG: flagellar basal-body MS-ring/collar protein FliF [Candidatus Aquicultor sp.]|nr:flagellar basal-body MS-ring/collar protein FliF [Candidatus Aquicultor sp.]
MASPPGMLENAKTGWDKLDINQKMIILMTIILFVVALGSLFYWVSRPSYSVLFSNLSSEDAGAIVAKLQEKKVPYRLNGSSIIEVPSDQVHEARIQLAGEGLPEGGTVGFEIFDQTNFGLSEFAQKLNYRRALEGELGRTISQINEIEGARVHIVLPEPSLYKDKENPATASVIIKPRAGARLADSKVQGIVNLVSKSIEGLKTENITVVDTTGNILNEATGDSSFASGGNYTKTQLGAKEAYEGTLETSIESMLGKVLGSENNAVVRVSADLDFTQKNKASKIVKQEETPVVISEEVDKEKYEGQGASPGGIPGVTSQVPSSNTTDQQASATYPSAGQGDGDSTYSHQKKTTNYGFTEISEQEVKAPGELKKLSVAVVVNNDGSKPIRDETIEELVSAACGIDKGRGDVLTVSSVPFDTEWMKKEEKAIADAQQREMYAEYGKYALVAILFMVGLFALLKVVSSLRPARQSELLTPRSVSVAGAASLDLGDISISKITPEKKREMQIEQRRSQLTKEEIQNLAKERPGDVAQLLRIWLNT